jgi:hypothetical protein
VYNLDDIFGVSGDQLQAMDNASPNSPTYTKQAGTAPGGQTGTVASFTDWRRSPVFWLAVFAVFALGYLHVEGSVKAALR